MKKRKTLLIVLFCGILVVAAVGVIKVIEYFTCYDCWGPNVSLEKERIRVLSLALDHYKRKTGAYPSTSQGLRVLAEGDVFSGIPGGAHIQNMVLQDTWGNPYIYESPGRHGHDFEITSYGADGKEGGKYQDADLHSWEVESEHAWK